MAESVTAYFQFKLLRELSTVENIYLVKLAADAQAALAVLDHELRKLPNPYLLLDNLLLQESKTSNLIENIVITNDELYRGIASEDQKGIQEVLNYKQALCKGFKVIKDKGVLSIGDLITINSELSGSPTAIRTNGSREMLDTPPHGEELLYRLLVDLLEYVYFDDRYAYHPLLKIALAHYQFQCIHPFNDGTGQTGRILSILLICQKGMLCHPVLGFSSYLLQYKAKYHELLLGTRRNNDYEDITAFILRGFTETAKKTLVNIEQIKGQIAEYKQYVRENTIALSETTSQKVPEEVIELVFEKVYCRVADLTTEGKHRLGDIVRPPKEPDKQAGKNKRAGKLPAHRETAALYLRALEKIGLLVSEKVNNSVIYKNIELVKLFESEEFAPYDY